MQYWQRKLQRSVTEIAQVRDPAAVPVVERIARHRLEVTLPPVPRRTSALALLALLAARRSPAAAPTPRTAATARRRAEVRAVVAKFGVATRDTRLPADLRRPAVRDARPARSRTSACRARRRAAARPRRRQEPHAGDHRRVDLRRPRAGHDPHDRRPARSRPTTRSSSSARTTSGGSRRWPRRRDSRRSTAAPPTHDGAQTTTTTATTKTTSDHEDRQDDEDREGPLAQRRDVDHEAVPDVARTTRG